MTPPPSASVTPLAYFLTFHCYGTWLQGDVPGSVDREHREYGTPVVPPNSHRRQAHRNRMRQEPYSLDAPRRRLVLQAIREVCTHRGWQLWAVHVRTTHVHVVVSGASAAEAMLNAFKAYASRALNRAGLDGAECCRWSRHGSTQYVWQPNHLREVIHYTLNRQGEPMDRFAAPEVDAPGAFPSNDPGNDPSNDQSRDR